MVEIRLDRLTKRFGDFTAVDGLETVFPSGQVTCLLGPSGCGKTTLMRMIAGLESPSEGRILIGGRDMGTLPPRKRDIGMVFQYPVMYPTLTVAENIGAPLREDRSLARADRERRVAAMLDALEMTDLADATIDELNAGLRQKVAVGRAVAREAQVVLFDEPTTNVEVNAKLSLIRAVKLIATRLRQTIVYVTHDQTEAMTLADQVALMQAGRIVQQDAPRALYAQPADGFAGWFIGAPGMNVLPAEARDGMLRSPFLATPTPLSAPPSGALTLGVRPEWFDVGAGPAEGEVVDSVIGIAGRRLMTVRAGDVIAHVKCAADTAQPVGGRLRFGASPDRAVLFADGRRVDWGKQP